MVYILLQIETFSELKRVVSVFSAGTGGDRTLILICDGVVDDVQEYLESIKNCRILSEVFSFPLGMGASLSAGFNLAARDSKSDKDLLITTHSACLGDEELLKALLSLLEQNRDVVIASRYGNSLGYQRFPFLRKLYSRILNHFMRRTFPINGVQDYSVFLRGYRLGLIREAIQMFGPFGLVQSRGYVANTEILVKLSFLTAEINEVYHPFDFRLLTGRKRVDVFKSINEYMVLSGYLKRIRHKIHSWRERESMA